jgi:glycosyltransferase involved in cell wall biosynthesis
MRILAIHTVYRPLGGAEFYLLRLAEALEESGHEVMIAYPDDETEPYHHPGRTELTLPRARGRATGKRALAELERIIDRYQPDLVHFHSTVGFLTGAVIAGCARKLPVAKHVHDARVFCPRLRSKILPGPAADSANALPRHCQLAAGWQCLRQGCLQADRRGAVDVGPLSEHAREVLIRLGELRALRRIDGLFCSSNYIRDELVRNRIPAERIHVVGFFLPWEREATRPADPATEPPVIGAVGRWDGVKGLELLLELLIEIAPRVDFRARLLGGGPGLEEGRERIAAAGLRERIELPGYLDDEKLREFYSGLSLLAFPSLIPESFGAAGIEAHAHGVPVVGFAAGGVRDWLQHERNGLLGPVGDREFLRDGLLRLLHNPEERTRLGLQARVDAWERYEKRAQTERYLRALQDLVEQRRR